MSKDAIFRLCDQVRELSFGIHRWFGPGHLEKVYENALAHRLRKAGIPFEQSVELTVYEEDGTPVGKYEADLIIAGQIIVELKAAKDIADEHIAQLFCYLRTTGMEHGLLINFGASKLFIKKYILDKYIPPIE